MTLMSSHKTPDTSYFLKKRIPKLVVPLVMYTAIAVFHPSNTNSSLSTVKFLDTFAHAGSKPDSTL